jgi:hypothetical protein
MARRRRSRPLGAASEPRSEAVAVVPPGSMLLWYSDGLVERRDADLDDGLLRLSSVASRLDGDDPQTWCDAVMHELTGSQRLHDDVVLFRLRLGAPGSDKFVPPPVLSLDGDGARSARLWLPDLAPRRTER